MSHATYEIFAYVAMVFTKLLKPQDRTQTNQNRSQNEVTTLHCKL